MARKRERVFAIVVALLFLGTSLGGSVAIIWAMVHDGSKVAPPVKQANTCQDTGAEPTLPPPEIYKPEGKASSLQSTDLEAGSGAAAKNNDCLVVKYYGTLASDGTKFDENFTQPTAFAFNLGQQRVIPGWDKGLVGLKVGGTRRLVIPSDLAYGAQAQGSIPANSDLVFVVKLLKIQK